MTTTLEFIALHVPDLREAETFYRTLLDMEIITREAPMDDGIWYALPADKDWSDLDRAGIQLGMLALRRDDFVLALFPGDPVPGQVYALGLSMAPEEIDALYARLAPEAVREYEAGRHLQFRDAYGYAWQAYKSPYEFQGTDRWLSLP